ncbi:MAG: acetate--CoA ligase family protein [Methylococcales bacterium]|nr:acetate--CoA ligase family protein [Methylococcales bacterium]
MISYQESVTLLQQYDIHLPPAHLVATAKEAVEAAELLGYPVALKAVSPDLSHKSDRGLVKLGLDNADAVLQASHHLLQAEQWQNPQSPTANRPTLEGLLVQKMMPAGVEMIAGIHTDPQFGAIVVLGSGGVLVEMLDDVVIRLPPLTHQQAQQMIEETKSYRLLQGYRHFLAGDMPALRQLIVNLSQLAVAESERVFSFDFNPVIVLPAGQGIAIVDVRIEENIT